MKTPRQKLTKALYNQRRKLRRLRAQLAHPYVPFDDVFGGLLSIGLPDSLRAEIAKVEKKIAELVAQRDS